MYAVIRTGGKQYKVAPEDVLQIEKIEGAAGDAVSFPDVLMVAGEGGPTCRRAARFGRCRLGRGCRTGARAEGHHLQEEAPPELPAQERPPAGLTTVRILEILTDGKAPSIAATRRNKRIAPRFEGERQWHIKKQAVHPGTAATPKAGASA